MNSFIIGAIAIGAFMWLKNKGKKVIEQDSDFDYIDTDTDYQDNTDYQETDLPNNDIPEDDYIDYEEVETMTNQNVVSVAMDFKFVDDYVGQVRNCICNFYLTFLLQNPRVGASVNVSNIRLLLTDHTYEDEKKRKFSAYTKYLDLQSNGITLTDSTQSKNIKIYGTWSPSNFGRNSWQSYRYLAVLSYKVDGVDTRKIFEINV